MIFRLILGFLAAFQFSSVIHADSIKINPDHPDQYTVVKGDTLWDISGKFLQYPWHWPKLWHSNQHIENPDLIYPGDTLYFSMVDGQPRLSFSKNVTLKPRIRVNDIDEELKIISVSEISQFLNSPMVISDDSMDYAPYIIGFAGEHIIAGPGDKIYARAIHKPEPVNYTIYRKGRTFISPVNNEILGYEAIYVAEATLQKTGDPATLYVDKSDYEIRKGDRLMYSNVTEIALNYFPRPPETPINGNIISVLDGVTEIGQHNVVVIDKGAVDGLKTGHVLGILHRGEIVRDPFSQNQNEAVQLPDEQAGLLMIFRVFDRVSYAMVMEATQAIHILDKVISAN